MKPNVVLFHSGVFDSLVGNGNFNILLYDVRKLFKNMASFVRSLHIMLDDKNIDLFINAIDCVDYNPDYNVGDRLKLYNLEVVKALCNYFSYRNILSVHLSTFAVFDGQKEKPYKESDAANPIGLYGQIKLESEKLISSLLKDCIIFRMPWIYSVSGVNSFVYQVINAMKNNSVLNVFEDQVGEMFNVFDFNSIIGQILSDRKKIKEKLLSAPAGVNVFHFSTGDFASKFDIAESIFKTFKKHYGSFLKTTDVNPVMGSSLENANKIQLNCCLDPSYFKMFFEFNLPDWMFSLYNATQKIINEVVVQNN